MGERRHRDVMIEQGEPLLSAYGMARYRRRRGQRWPTKPSGVIEPHKSSEGHSGNHPLGKVPKSKRVQAALPGTPNGVCQYRLNAAYKGECNCGKRHE